MAKKVLINGAVGRIGRGVTHQIVKRSRIDNCPLKLAALNDIVGIGAAADNYLGRDPVHGIYDWAIRQIDDKNLSINGKPVIYFSEKDISKIPFKDLGIDIVLECSGFFGDPKVKDESVKLKPEDNLSRQFLKYGAERVIQTYPAKTADAALIMGANHHNYDPSKHFVISNASCTTKSLAVPLQVLIDNGIEIEDLGMVTVHAATASQKILDSLGQITTHPTGAAKATGEVISSLKGKMSGASARVPILDGSISYMFFVAHSSSEIDAEKLNKLFRISVSNSRYSGRLGVLEGEIISSADIVNREENALIIPYETKVRALSFSPSGKKAYHITLVSGYDNELGSCVDTVMLTEHVAVRS